MNELIDLREAGNHPSLLKYKEIFNAAVLNGQIKYGRSQPGFSLSGMSPFVVAAKEAVAFGLDKSGVLDAVISVFRKYYNSIQIDTAAEWYGISNSEGSELKKTPPWGAVFPWRGRSIVSYQKAFEKAAIEENLSVGKEGGIEKGWLFNGPVEEFKVKVESERMLFVLRQIHNNGYKRSDDLDGDARATALVDEEFNWRWLLTGGNHRASAAAALGFESIPIRVNLVINRSEVDFWNHVQNKTFTRIRALSVFDSYFNAEPLISTKLYIESINKNKI